MLINFPPQRLLKADSPQSVRIEAGLSVAVILAVLAEVLQRASWVLGKFRQQESLLRSDTVLLVRPLACRMANTSDPNGKPDILFSESNMFNRFLFLVTINLKFQSLV